MGGQRSGNKHGKEKKKDPVAMGERNYEAGPIDGIGKQKD